MSTEAQFKRLVDSSVEEKCLEYLNAEKNKKSKVMHINYKKLETQSYLLPSMMSMTQAKHIFMLRTRMLDTKDNYPNKYPDNLCPICDDGITKDSQEHVMFCLNDSNQMIVNSDVQYTNLFSNDVNKQLQVSLIIAENFSKRKEKLRKKAEENKKNENRK